MATIDQAGSAVDRRPLTDREVDRLARDEMPELTRQLRSVARLVVQLQALNDVEQQCDLDGLHDVVDRALSALLAIHQDHPGVVALEEMVEQIPGMRPPLLTKVALVSLLV